VCMCIWICNRFTKCIKAGLMTMCDRSTVFSFHIQHLHDSYFTPHIYFFRYNAKLSVVENIKLPPTLLSRFDLIYLILDKPNEDQDRKLARHLVSLYYDDAEAETKEEETNASLRLVDQKFLRDYILYARNNICPEISDAAAEVTELFFICISDC